MKWWGSTDKRSSQEVALILARTAVPNEMLPKHEEVSQLFTAVPA